MKKLILFILCLLQLNSYASQDTDNAEALATAQDYLGLRIQLIKLYNKPVTFQDWVKIRRLVFDTPQIGYDIAFAWDRHKRITGAPKDSAEVLVDKAIKKAEQFVDEKKYKQAFEVYQLAATKIKGVYRKRVGKENKNIYYWLLHQMGRTLYSSGNYDQALEVYSWIPTKYYQFRQVQFEKMWTAFRMNKFDIAIGSIVSQQSSYYSKYIEPESYLVKLYILKKLCNEPEIKKVMLDIDDYLGQIKNRKLKLREWAKNDLYDYSTSLLLNVSEQAGRTDIITVEQRLEQKSKIAKKLNRKFADDQERIFRDLTKVKGYALLMKSENPVDLKETLTIPTSDILSSQGLEYWPTSKNEEWVDEAGQYLYNGKSYCKTSEKKSAE